LCIDLCTGSHEPETVELMRELLVDGLASFELLGHDDIVFEAELLHPRLLIVNEVLHEADLRMDACLLGTDGLHTETKALVRAALQNGPTESLCRLQIFGSQARPPEALVRHKGLFRMATMQTTPLRAGLGSKLHSTGQQESKVVGEVLARKASSPETGEVHVDGHEHLDLPPVEIETAGLAHTPPDLFEVSV
jgi:hypothetical protein